MKVSVLAACALFCAAPAFAECVSPPPIAEEAPGTEAIVGASSVDRLGRVVAPMLVNGQGPFRFIVDTGANRSVLSRGLADRLGLSPNGTGEVHSIDGVATAPLVSLESFTFDRLAMPGAAVPILPGSRVFAGEEGILGVDGMQGRRLRVDFRRRCLEIVPSRGASRLHSRDWVEVRGELRFGNLVVIPGRVRGVDVNILVDTGSDSSLMNTAMRDALVGVALPPGQLTPGRAYTAGRPILFEGAAVIPSLELHDVEVSRITALIGDFHIFSLWGFNNEPTLLMGMDVIGQTEGIAIDYERATVHFRLPRRGRVL